MITFGGIYLLVIAMTVTGDVEAVGLLMQPDMQQCEIVRRSSFYQDPKYRRVECVKGAAIISESLVGNQIDKLSGTMDMLRRSFQP